MIVPDKKQLTQLDLDAGKRFAGPLLFRVEVVQDQVDSSKQILATGGAVVTVG